MENTPRSPTMVLQETLNTNILAVGQSMGHSADVQVHCQIEELQDNLFDLEVEKFDLIAG